MHELIDEHIVSRKVTKDLVEANAKYRSGDPSALAVIVDKLGFLADFYPKHIFKEDKVFFPACGKYFSQEEDQAMLQEFWEFDREMIHEKYRTVLRSLDV